MKPWMEASKPMSSTLSPHPKVRGRTSFTASRLALFLFGCLMTALMSGGLILGYGAFYKMLIQEHQWQELCPDDEVCPRQEMWIQSVFTTSYLGLSISNIVFGILLDITGPRRCVVIGLSLAVVGNIFVAWGQSTVFYGLFIILGYFLVGFGGLGVSLSTFQFTNLFPQQGLPCSILSGLFNCSAYIYMILNIPGVSRSYFFILYALLACTCLLFSLVLFPSQSYTKVAKYAEIKWPSLRCSASMELGSSSSSREIRRLFQEIRPLIAQPHFWMFALMFGWISLINSYIGGALPDIMNQHASEQERKGKTLDLYQTILYPLISNACFFFSPMVGLAIDRIGMEICIGCTIFFAQCFLVSLWANDLQVHLLTFVFMNLEQSFLYTLQFAFCLILFPAGNYGFLQATLCVVSFCCCLLAYGLNSITQDLLGGNYDTATVILLAPTFLFYILPYYMYRNHHKIQKVRTNDQVLVVITPNS